MTAWSARAAAATALGLTFLPVAAAIAPAAAASPPAPVAVTIVVALTLPERTTGFVDSVLLASYTSPFGLLTRALDQVIDRPVVLGIDPSILASIRVLGNKAPASATAWLARLDTATNETFPLTWADADLTLGLQAGSKALLATESVDFAIDPELFAEPTTPVEQSTPTPTPSPSASLPPGDAPLPTAESLVAWDYTVSSIAWPAMNSVTANDLAFVAESYETTILSSSNVGSTSARVASATIDGKGALLVDDSISALVSGAVSTTSASDWQAAIARLVTAIGEVRSTSDDPASVLIALDRVVMASDADLGVTIDALTKSQNARAAQLRTLLDAKPLSANLVDQPHDLETIESVQKLLNHEAADRAFATIAENPALITGERRLNLLATLSNSWGGNPIGWKAARVTFETASSALRSAVKIAKSSSITLWADRASLPVTVSNELDQAVTVYVTVRPATPLLKIENSLVAVTVEPKSQRKASIPVQSLSNGVVDLAVTLHGETGVAVGSRKDVRITVQAGWETPFTVGVAVLVVLIFAAGIVRTVVRRRRAHTIEG